MQPGKDKQNSPYYIAIEYWRACIIIDIFQKVSILNTEPGCTCIAELRATNNQIWQIKDEL